MPAVDAVDVAAPVDRDQRRGQAQQQRAAAAEVADPAEALRGGQQDRHDDHRPHDPVGEDLDRARGLEQRPVEREEAPQQIRREARGESGPEHPVDDSLAAAGCRSISRPFSTRRWTSSPCSTPSGASCSSTKPRAGSTSARARRSSARGWTTSSAPSAPRPTGTDFLDPRADRPGHARERLGRRAGRAPHGARGARHARVPPRPAPVRPARHHRAARCSRTSCARRRRWRRSGSSRAGSRTTSTTC